MSVLNIPVRTGSVKGVSLSWLSSGEGQHRFTPGLGGRVIGPCCFPPPASLSQFMSMFHRVPQRLPETYRSRAAANINADRPSGNESTDRPGPSERPACVLEEVYRP